MDLEMREVEIGDIENLSKIYRNDGVRHQKKLERYPLMEWIVGENNLFIIAEKNKRQVGFILVRFKGEESKIDLFSVKKTYHGKGVETELLSTTESLIRRGTIRFYVAKSNKYMARIMKKHGFHVEDEIKDLFGEKDHGLLFEKKLDVPLFRGIGKRKKKGAEKPPSNYKVLKRKAVYKRGDYLKDNLEKLDELL